MCQCSQSETTYKIPFSVWLQVRLARVEICVSFGRHKGSSSNYALNISEGYNGEAVCTVDDLLTPFVAVGPAGLQLLWLPPTKSSFSFLESWARQLCSSMGKGMIPSLRSPSSQVWRQMWGLVCTHDFQFVLSGTSLSSHTPTSRVGYQQRSPTVTSG